MKKTYIIPSIKVTYVGMESLMAGSIGGGLQKFAKEHDSFINFWDDEEEDDAPSMPHVKSVWED